MQPVRVVTSSLSSDRAFTLVELMVAMAIMIVGLLGLLKGVEVAMQYSMKNQFRNEAVRIGEEFMGAMKDSSFDAAFNPYTTVTPRFKGVSKQFGVTRTTTFYPGSKTSQDTRELVVRVSWSYKNISSSHEVRSMKARGQ